MEEWKKKWIKIKEMRRRDPNRSEIIAVSIKRKNEREIDEQHHAIYSDQNWIWHLISPSYKAFFNNNLLMTNNDKRAGFF